MNKIIQLAGFGDLNDKENATTKKDLQRMAKKHNCELYPTYYDYELKGTEKDIEAITMELWSMPKDQWTENALTIMK
jgi:hypothetical protein